MKTNVFLKPLELSLEAIGEKWHQGDKIKGSIRVINNSLEKIDRPALRVAICHGHFKKIKAKDEKGWTTLSEKEILDVLSVNSSSEQNYNFEFSLAEDCSITDKNGSLYLVFFYNDDKIPAGHIELLIEPKIVIQNILQIIESFLRFKVKEIKYNKSMVDIKLVPPTSRELSNLDGLVLSISEIDKKLILKYSFNLRVLNITGATMQSEKKVQELEQVFHSNQYLIYGDSINQDFIVASVQEILNVVKTKLL